MIVQYRRDLYKLLPIVREAICCELGVAEGFFSYDMLSWGIKHLHMIDMWECMPAMKGDAANDQHWHDANYEAARKRVEKFPMNSYEILRGPTTRMAGMIKDNSLDLIHIDADHSYEGVMADLRAYFPKMKTGGVISGHDYLNKAYGVNKAVREFCGGHDITYIQTMFENKDEDAGFYFFKP